MSKAHTHTHHFPPCPALRQKTMSISFHPAWRSPPSPLVETVPSPSQLVKKDIYEGGQQVWECANDLSEFLQEGVLDDLLSAEFLRVLELGSGQGTPSLTLCKLREARGLKTSVTLQDLNESTLCGVTASLWIDQLTPHLTTVRLVATSWSGMLRDTLTDDEWTYDLLLSAETLYRKENYPDIIAIIKRLTDQRKGIQVRCLHDV
eukprot:Blabericola_migrator_1__5694@NODE_288_length_10293_cov_65_527675_g237_i0_p5_GENE_NODE_288_length_10293_cov_65_527675_g237_i0NODE_288_length_10293_cov_65_527675_g237_i0_p5_ORF_typecomplete_len205_score49_42Methyltransf_16/PF10294_9/1_2e17Methyltransf_23/PF13489_6/0_00085Methyltransf_31/PF13847_6/0_0062Methyltransf_25/PF13649_6/0_2MTS/PF05175_14/0_24_NODE_288_length_10293_cov_65_527675_g237_i023292943